MLDSKKCAALKMLLSMAAATGLWVDEMQRLGSPDKSERAFERLGKVMIAHLDEQLEGVKLEEKDELLVAKMHSAYQDAAMFKGTFDQVMNLAIRDPLHKSPVLRKAFLCGDEQVANKAFEAMEALSNAPTGPAAAIPLFRQLVADAECDARTT